MDEELETKIEAVMCVHVDANRTLSQLSYRPKSTVPKAEQKNKAQLSYRPKSTVPKAEQKNKAI